MEVKDEFMEYKRKMGCNKVIPEDSNPRLATLCRWCFAYYLKYKDIPCDLSTVRGE